MKKENVPSINMKHKVLLEMWKKFAIGTFVVKTQHYVSMDASFIELMQDKNANGHIQDPCSTYLSNDKVNHTTDAVIVM